MDETGRKLGFKCVMEDGRTDNWNTWKENKYRHESQVKRQTAPEFKCSNTQRMVHDCERGLHGGWSAVSIIIQTVCCSATKSPVIHSRPHAKKRQKRTENCSQEVYRRRNRSSIVELNQFYCLSFRGVKAYIQHNKMSLINQSNPSKSLEPAVAAPSCCVAKRYIGRSIINNHETIGLLLYRYCNIKLSESTPHNRTQQPNETWYFGRSQSE